MPWVRLDDQFPEHPKVVEAGPLAGWLYVCGLAYCARQLTDGFIPSAQLRRLLPTGSVAKLADCLVAVRLWERAAGGFRVHDYLSYNPTREQTLALRQQKASAGRKGGWQKASNVLAERQASATTPVPIPVPIPMTASPTEHLEQQQTEPAVLTHGDSPNRRARAGPVYSLDFEAWWKAYPRHDGKSTAAEAYARRVGAGRSPAVLERAVEQFGQHHDALGTPTDKLPHGATWLNQHRDEEWERGPPDADRQPVAANGRGAPFRDDRSPTEKAANPTRAWRETWESAEEPAHQEATR